VDCEKQVILLLLELALEIVLPPTSNLQVESICSETSEDESSFLSATSFGLSRLDKERVYNASAVVVLIRSLLVFTPKVQLELLRFIEKLAIAGPFNQENLTCVGMVKRYSCYSFLLTYFDMAPYVFVTLLLHRMCWPST